MKSALELPAALSESEDPHATANPASGIMASAAAARGSRRKRDMYVAPSGVESSELTTMTLLGACPFYPVCFLEIGNLDNIGSLFIWPFAGPRSVPFHLMERMAGLLGPC
ncbi:hypothetical protein ACETU7_21965 [Rhodococcus sp. 3Y1]